MRKQERSFWKNLAELAKLERGFTFENQEEWVKQHPQEVARMKEILESMGMLPSVPLLQEETKKIEEPS